MQEQTEYMDNECLVQQDILQDPNNFDPAAGEDDTRGPASRGRDIHTGTHRSSKAGSVDAASRQAASRSRV